MKTVLRCVTALLLFLPAGLAGGQDDAGVPPAVVESWSYLMGGWDVEGRIGAAPVKGSASFDCAEGRHCYIGRQVWTIGENGHTTHLTLIGGWDAAANETIEQGFSSTGDAATVRYPTRAPSAEAGVIGGKIVGVNGPNRRWTGSVELNRRGPNEFKLTTTVDGEVVHSLKYVRSKVPRPPAADGLSDDRNNP